MDQILLGLGAAGAALLIIAVAVALWEHRRHMAEMRQQLAWSDNTRDLLQAHAKDVDARLATLSAAVNMQSAVGAAPAVQQPANNAGPALAPAGPPVAAPAPPETTRATSALPAVSAPQAAVQPAPRLTAHAGSAAVAMAAAQSAVTQQWIDTEPMVLTSQVLDFDPTMPAELSEY